MSFFIIIVVVVDDMVQVDILKHFILVMDSL